MEIKNFTVVSKQVSETQRGIIDGNTVELNYSYTQEQKPLVVSFSVFRGKEGDKGFTGVPAISGHLDTAGDLQTQTHDKRKRTDRALINKVWDVCEGLLSVEEEE